MDTIFEQKYNGHRLRTGRFSEAKRIYHLTSSTKNRRPYFSDIQLGRIVVQALRYQHDQGKVHSLAFVVMPDHLHWLVQLGPDTTLAKLMAMVKGWSTTRIQQIVNNKDIWQRVIMIMRCAAMKTSSRLPVILCKSIAGGIGRKHRGISVVGCGLVVTVGASLWGATCKGASRNIQIAPRGTLLQRLL